MNNMKTCISCNKGSNSLFTITKCAHAQFLLKVIDNSVIQLSDILFCSECHSILKKADLFQRKVEENCRNFINQCEVQLPEPKPLPYKLDTLRDICKVTIPDDFDPPIGIKTEVYEVPLLEYGAESDCETKPEIFLDQVSEANTVKRSRTKKKEVEKEDGKKSRRRDKRIVVKKEPTEEVSSKEGEKIRKIVMTMEELMVEREKERTSPAFIKLAYKCDGCIVGFDYEQKYKEHMSKKHDSNKGPYVCEVCASVFDKERCYVVHSRRHYVRFECLTCGRRMMEKCSLENHLNDHNNTQQEYTCDICGFVAQTKRSFRYHKEKHTFKSQCADCGKTFCNKDGLNRHIMDVHMKTRTFSCDQCDKIYRNKSGLLMHKLTHTTHADAFCGSCSIQFKTKYTYQQHLKTHSRHALDDDKRFVCEDCGRKFVHKKGLQVHIDMEHLKIFRHACDICDKKYARAMSLRLHVKYVHEKKKKPKNKVCDHCGRSFTTNAILTAHIRTHTGERPLTCQYCPASFAHSAALYTHNKLLHKHKDADGT